MRQNRGTFRLVQIGSLSALFFRHFLAIKVRQFRRTFRLTHFAVMKNTKVRFPRHRCTLPSLKNAGKGTTNYLFLQTAVVKNHFFSRFCRKIHKNTHFLHIFISFLVHLPAVLIVSVTSLQERLYPTYILRNLPIHKSGRYAVGIYPSLSLPNIFLK